MEFIQSGSGFDVTNTLAIALVALSANAAYWDLRYRRIPNWLTIGGFVVAILLRGTAGLGALGIGLVGGALAFGLALPLFALGGLGGGDVKLLAAVGAFLGPAQLAVALVVMALTGGVMAMIAVIRHRAYRKTFLNLRTILSSGFKTSEQRSKGSLVLPTIRSPDALTVPYGVAIAIGATAGAVATLGVMS